MSPCPFHTTITITSRDPPLSIYKYKVRLKITEILTECDLMWFTFLTQSFFAIYVPLLSVLQCFISFDQESNHRYDVIIWTSQLMNFSAHPRTYACVCKSIYLSIAWLTDWLILTAFQPIQCYFASRLENRGLCAFIAIFFVFFKSFFAHCPIKYETFWNRSIWPIDGTRKQFYHSRSEWN